MSWLRNASIAYGALNILFGILGFVNAHSVMSLIAGGVAGVAAIFGAIHSQKDAKIGFAIVTVVSVLIFGRFFKPGVMEGKIYPALILVIASVAMIVALVIGHFSARKSAA